MTFYHLFAVIFFQVCFYARSDRNILVLLTRELKFLASNTLIKVNISFSEQYNQIFGGFRQNFVFVRIAMLSVPVPYNIFIYALRCLSSIKSFFVARCNPVARTIGCMN